MSQPDNRPQININRFVTDLPTNLWGSALYPRTMILAAISKIPSLEVAEIFAPATLIVDSFKDTMLGMELAMAPTPETFVRLTKHLGLSAIAFMATSAMSLIDVPTTPTQA